ncbi:lysin [Enterobacter phage Phc]|nr:lysin [Enterobacter phage Phc]
MNNIMKSTLTGVMLITAGLLSQLEGTYYTPYIDIAGVPTVCEGITGKDVIWGKKYTRRECDQLLEKHIGVAARAVDKAVKVEIPNTMRAALYSFTFNAGQGAFRSSTLLRLTNQGRLREACGELNKWVYFYNPKTGKKEIAKGLKNRRAVEYQYCVKDLK